ncbi:hypothetical protein GCM10027048_18830 [Hymenobacter coalescens]
MLFLLTAAVLSFATAQAQTAPATTSTPAGYQGRGPGMGRGEQRTPEQRADMQTQRLSKQLTLSAEQQTRVRAIFLAQANELDAARAQKPAAGMDRETMRQKMQEGRARYDEQLKGVLTAEQFAKYTQQREDRMERVEEAKEARKETKMKAKATKTKTKVKAS